MNKDCRVCNDTLDCNGNPVAETAPGDNGQFMPESRNTVAVHPSNVVDVHDIQAVFFTDASGVPVDVKVLLNDGTIPFPVAVGQPLWLSPSTEKITVDKAATMFAMAR